MASAGGMIDQALTGRNLILAVPCLFVASRLGYVSRDTVLALAGATYVAFLVSRLQTFLLNVSRTRHIPGRNYLLGPLGSLPALLLPRIRFINSELSGGGIIDAEKTIAQAYTEYDSTISSVVGAFPPSIYLQVADPVTIRHIYTHNNDFPKNTSVYFAIKKFGNSLILAEGADFRRHRRIVASAFAGEAQNQLDWQESTKVTNAWMKVLDAQIKESGRGYTEEAVLERCLGLALYVICRTAFGVWAPMPGETAGETPPGFKYSFFDTLNHTLENIFTLIAAPPALKGWFPSKPIQEAFVYKEEMDKWMDTLVKERRAEGEANGLAGNDLLSLLVKSNNAYEGQTLQENGQKDSGKPLVKQVLDESETRANVWLFLLAGHETSSHTLTYCLGLLALYPNEQDRLYEEACEVCPDADAEIPFSLFGQYVRAEAVINESLRLYPPVLGIPKMVDPAYDVVVPTSERGPLKGEPITIPRGTNMFLDVGSVHHDPSNWKDPEDFKPDRFIDTEEYKWPRDAFIPFSGGVRVCTGQNFARIELVCILINLCRKFKVSVRPEDMLEGESRQELRKRLLRSTQLLTMSPSRDLKLRFERRS